MHSNSPHIEKDRQKERKKKEERLKRAANDKWHVCSSMCGGGEEGVAVGVRRRVSTSGIDNDKSQQSKPK